MKYSYAKNLNSSFESTENKVREALQNIGFGVLTEISIKDAFKSKLDLEYKNYKILGACNPPLAHEAINFDEMIGILMPCNILLIDNEDGTTKVVFPNAKSILDITDNKDMMDLSIKVDNLLKGAFNEIS
tara:strand:- start:378 stop:767 length:390 start_codon:yes stop_codon:yes gene_type:complete